MEWLKELYGWVGVPYPRLSLASVALLAAGLGVAAWRFIGWQYAKDHVQTTVTPTQKPKESEQYEPGLKEAALDKATLHQAREALDKLEGEFTPQELAQAYEGLAKGDPGNAETLFQRILAVSGSTVSIVGSRAKAFTATRILAQLAEGHGDYQAALRYKEHAMQFNPAVDSVQSHGWVGDDGPKVIRALSTLPLSKRTISGIHEATGVNDSTIKKKLELLENDGLAVKSETEPPYWSLTPKGREAFANLQ